MADVSGAGLHKLVQVQLVQASGEGLIETLLFRAGFACGNEAEALNLPRENLIFTKYYIYRVSFFDGCIGVGREFRHFYCFLGLGKKIASRTYSCYHLLRLCPF